MPILAAIAVAVGALYVYLRKVLGATVPEGLTIVRDADDSTEIDVDSGAVRSVQSAEVALPADTIDELWTPMSLERLARTYWRFLQRATLGLVRVYYTETERYVCLLIPQLKLLTFRAPEYEMDDRRGVVRWRIEKGLLVARPGREGDGYLEIDVVRKSSAARRLGQRRGRGRGRELLPRDRLAPGPLALRPDAVAHPRRRHAGLPALARATRPRALRGRPLRRRRRGARPHDALAQRPPERVRGARQVALSAYP